MGKTERRISRGRARSGREPLGRRGHVSTGLSIARGAKCAVLVRTVVGALHARSAVGHKSASTDVSALSARSAVGHKSASTVVGARIARSARSSERIINQITTSQSVLVPSPSILNRLSRYRRRLPRRTTSRPYPRLYHRSHRRPALSALACSPRLD